MAERSQPPVPSDDSAWPELRGLDVPGPSPQFVARAAARLDADPDVALSRLLARHRVPPPSADFVARTLALLAETKEPQATTDAARTGPSRTIDSARRAFGVRAWLAAAALLVAGAALVVRFGSGVDPFVISPDAVWAQAQPVAVAFGRSTRRQLAVAPHSDFFTRVRFDHVDPISLLVAPPK